MHPATYRQEFGWICMGSFLIFSQGRYIHNSHAVAGSSAKGNQIQICVFHCQNDDEEIIFQMSPTQNLNHKQDLAIGELETALLEKHFLWMGEQKIQGKWSGINQGTGWDGFASSSSKAWPWHVWFTEVPRMQYLLKVARKRLSPAAMSGTDVDTMTTLPLFPAEPLEDWIKMFV